MRSPKGQAMMEYFCICCLVTVITAFIFYLTMQVLKPIILQALQGEINYLNTPYWTQPGLNGAS